MLEHGFGQVPCRDLASIWRARGAMSAAGLGTSAKKVGWVFLARAWPGSSGFRQLRHQCARVPPALPTSTRHEHQSSCNCQPSPRGCVSHFVAGRPHLPSAIHDEAASKPDSGRPRWARCRGKPAERRRLHSVVITADLDRDTRHPQRSRPAHPAAESQISPPDPRPASW